MGRRGALQPSRHCDALLMLRLRLRLPLRLRLLLRLPQQRQPRLLLLRRIMSEWKFDRKNKSDIRSIFLTFELRVFLTFVAHPNF